VTPRGAVAPHQGGRVRHSGSDRHDATGDRRLAKASQQAGAGQPPRVRISHPPAQHATTGDR
jgi:hypothetical protein